MTASVVVVGDRLALVLAAIRYPDGCSIYLADPGSEQFVVETSVPWGTISSSEAAAAFGLLDPAMRLPQLHACASTAGRCCSSNKACRAYVFAGCWTLR